MPPESLELDPAIRELLLDIARDKDSTLMRVPRGNLTPYTATGGRADLTALSSAERHLMQTHRIEVAYALRNLCRARLWEHPQARLHLMRPVTRTTFFEVPEQATSVARGLKALEPLHSLDEAAGIAELLEACIKPLGGKGPSTTQLAAASLRLEPTDQARIYCAIDSMFEGALDDALRITQTVLADGPSRSMQAYALTHVGSIESTRDNWGAAFEAYNESTSVLPDRSSPLLSGMLVSAFAKEFAHGEVLAMRIDEEYDEQHEAVTSFSSLARAFFLARNPGEREAELSFFSRLASNSQGATERILNEIIG